MSAAGAPALDTSRYVVRPGEPVRLSERPTDDAQGWTKDAAKAETARLIERMQTLQERLYAESRQSLLVVFQAMDGAGKDSTTRAVLGPLNPQGVHVRSFKAPSPEERAHDFLWRVHAAVPQAGRIAVFNRSHYEDVLVVRVRGLAPPDVVEARYEHIRAFERLLGEARTRIVKFMIHVSPAYQLRQFVERVEDPAKHWKFNPADLDDRRLWPAFMEAYEIAMSRTSTDAAPWIVVPAETKWFRNLLVARVLTDALEAMDPQFPPPAFDPAEWTAERVERDGRID